LERERSLEAREQTATDVLQFLCLAKIVRLLRPTACFLWTFLGFHALLQPLGGEVCHFDLRDSRISKSEGLGGI
jgi:hypothetical protein